MNAYRNAAKDAAKHAAAQISPAAAAEYLASLTDNLANIGADECIGLRCRGPRTERVCVDAWISALEARASE